MTFPKDATYPSMPLLPAKVSCSLTMEFTASPRFLPNSPTILTKRYSHDLVVVTEKAEIIMRRP